MGLRDVTYLEMLGHLELLGFTIGSTQPTRTCIPKLTPMVRLGNRTCRTWGETAPKRELNAFDKVTQRVAMCRLLLLGLSVHRRHLHRH